MKTARCFMVALLIAVGSADSAPRAPDGVEEELSGMEKIWNEAHLKEDAEALDRLWDDEILVIVPKMKLINKTEGLRMFRASRMKFLRYETSELRMRIDGDMAIVTGHLLRTRQMGERELQDDFRFAKVYQRRDGQWRVVLWQASEWPD